MIKQLLILSFFIGAIMAYDCSFSNCNFPFWGGLNGGSSSYPGTTYPQPGLYPAPKGMSII